MYPASLCGRWFDRWPTRGARIGFQSSRRARGAMTVRSVPIQVLTFRLVSFCSFWLVKGSQVSGCALRLRGPVFFAGGEHRPDDAGGLGGLGDDGEPDGSAGEDAADPGVSVLVGLGADMAQAAAGAQHQEAAQASVAGLADVSGETGLAASRRGRASPARAPSGAPNRKPPSRSAPAVEP